MDWYARYNYKQFEKVKLKVFILIGRLFNDFIGIPLVVKNTKNSSNKGFEEEVNLVNEVKRLGLLIDRYVDLELRIGDILVIYISRG